MKQKPTSLATLTTILLTTWMTAIAVAQQDAIPIDPRIVPGKFIPVSLSGFTGEVEAALKFDLAVAGFDFVSPDQALFQISGSNSGRVEGRVIDRLSKAQLLGKAYTGGDARRLAHALADDIVLSLTRKPGVAQTRIVFKVGRGKAGEIYLADYDGHNAVPVTRDGAIVAAPCWVPGHRMLCYTSYKPGTPTIFSHDLSSGVRQIVARYSGLNTSAAVSPDGQHVAMILSKGGSPNLYVSDLGGGNLKQLTNTREGESSPCWSPDGRKICVVSRTAGRAALYIVPASGGPMSRLSTAGAINATEPDWSPDGKTIAFTSLMGDFNICTVPATGGQANVLVGGEDPSWAPNSRTLIFTRGTRGSRVLSLLDVPTKRVKDIRQISGSCSQPSWAR